MKKNSALQRCAWVPLEDKLMVAYHDEEWGVPVHDDLIHFEFLILEGAQAGLSWQTILKRRANYVKAFSSFDPKKVAKFDSKKIEELLSNEGIIRNRLKIASVINNAKKFLDIQKEFGSFDNYVWKFVHNKPIHRDYSHCQSETKESKELSRDLKKRGFTFVGPTIIYAYMQAVGLVNDHNVDCYRHKEVQA